MKMLVLIIFHQFSPLNAKAKAVLREGLTNDIN